jgi:hypothetical protein
MVRHSPVRLPSICFIDKYRFLRYRCSKWVSSSARSNYFRDNASSRLLLPGQEERKTAAEQRGVSLFFCSPNRRRTRISAGNAISLADNFPQKQREQREQRFDPGVGSVYNSKVAVQPGGRLGRARIQPRGWFWIATKHQSR